MNNLFNKGRVAKLLGFACLAGLAPFAAADTYTFDNITGNSVADATAGEAQLRVDVTDAGAGKVSFKFYHVGVVPMSITDVYFDDGTLLGIATINESAGVDFEQGASPPDLPGGNAISPAFETTAGFNADSQPAAQPNGVNPGETVEIIFNLIGGKTFADTIAAITGPLGSGDDLRIGIHVQGFDGGGSESFVNNGPPPPPGEGAAPLPAVAWAGLALFGGVGMKRHRRR